ncbi:hypothetical protein SAMN05192566_1537 [Methylophilus rhizosphaerae]|uniref:Uncharacterized protein n=1 Tax=Methylophilus rhizosphaerae TaxID=492660 RepID=A0A1G9CMU7_9PROT|nr:hypothetical protein [Methylophilus rhizosphaerae]SDK52909.1 hypothetical protein SAMN05192566_1537 [Methylophilus rhizosphaerae]
MSRKFKEIDPNEFANANDIDKTTIKGEMRKLYSEIDRKLKEGGWSAKDVVTWFSARGLPVSVELFRVYLRDLDKEHGYKRSTNEYVNPTESQLGNSSVTTLTSTSATQPFKAGINNITNRPTAGESPKISSPADLKKARSQEVNLDDYEE